MVAISILEIDFLYIPFEIYSLLLGQHSELTKRKYHVLLMHIMLKTFSTRLNTSKRGYYLF